MIWRRGESKYYLESDPPGFRIAAYYSARSKDYILWRSKVERTEANMLAIKRNIPLKDTEAQAVAIAELKAVAEQL
jgi:hypothetical protein